MRTGQLSTSLTAFSRTIDDYSSWAKKELIPARKEKAVERMKVFREELTDYRGVFDKLKRERDQAVGSCYFFRDLRCFRGPGCVQLTRSVTTSNPHRMATNSTVVGRIIHLLLKIPISIQRSHLLHTGCRQLTSLHIRTQYYNPGKNMPCGKVALPRTQTPNSTLSSLVDRPFSATYISNMRCSRVYNDGYIALRTHWG